MMHLIVEKDIRQGLRIMKYVVNHPQNIKLNDIRKNDLVFKISQRSVFYAFMMGFIQTFVAITMEIIVIVYLASLKDIMAIIVKFVSMSGMVRFDDMYAAAIHEHKMKKAVNQKLKFTYKRKMNQNREDDPEREAFLSDNDEISNNETQEHPRKGRLCIQVMRVVQKLLRMFYVCLGYYFMPFFSVFITFFQAYYKALKIA